MRDVQLLDIIADPRFDAICENPRFRKIADGLGLTSGGNSTRPPASAAAARYGQQWSCNAAGEGSPGLP